MTGERMRWAEGPEGYDGAALGPYPEPDDELDLTGFWELVRRRWALVVVFCLLCFGTSLLAYTLAPRSYEAVATLQIERRSLLPGGDSVMIWTSEWWDEEYYPTQHKLLASRGLAEKVVKDRALFRDPRFLSAKVPWESAAAVSDDRLGQLADRLRGGLSVRPVADTHLVRIVYRSPSPELAAEVANGVAEAYIHWGVESRLAVAEKASTYLSEQIEALKKDIRERALRLQSYGRQVDIVAIDPASNITLKQLSVLNADYIAAVSARIGRQARANELLAAPDEDVAHGPGDSRLTELESEILRRELAYAGNLKVFKPDWPAMAEAVAEIEQLRQLATVRIRDLATRARKNAKAEAETALLREQSLTAEIERANEEVRELSSTAVEYTNLKVEVEARRQLLDQLLHQRSETELAERLRRNRASNARLVERALVPRGPYSPSLRRYSLAGLAGGLALAIGIAVLLELTDRTVKTVPQAERLLGWPVLGTVPDLHASMHRYGYTYRRIYVRTRSGQRSRWRLIKDRPAEDLSIELLPEERPRHPVSEAYRTLATTVLMGGDPQVKVLAVTSAQPGEGKTTTVVNLGVVTAQLGKKVLLIDGDLRRPRLQEIFGVENDEGLAQYLAEGTPIRYRRTKIPNLFLITSGRIPPNPWQLLASQRMDELLKHVAQHVDYVLIDTPPLLAVTDPSLMAKRADGTVVCLRAGKVLRQEVTACAERLRLGELKVLGSILNRCHPSLGGYRNYSYYYAAYNEENEERLAGSAA